MKVTSSPHSSLHPFHIRALYTPPPISILLIRRQGLRSLSKLVTISSQSRVAGWSPRSSSELPGRAQVGRGRQLVRFVSQ